MNDMSWKHLFPRYKLDPIPVGASGAEVLAMSTPDGNYILKQQRKKDAFHSLRNEMRNYQWLQGKMPVPTVIGSGEDDGMEWLCTSLVPGDSLADLLPQMDAEEWIGLYAATLKQLHAVPLDAVAPVRALDEYLAAAKLNMVNGDVSIEDLQEENKGFSPEQLYQRLIALKPQAIDPVFIHGDFTPENLLFDGGQLTGLVDVGRGGVADRHQDLALALRFIRDELGASYCDHFLSVYGWRPIDPGRLAFYELLDEFF